MDPAKVKMDDHTSFVRLFLHKDDKGLVGDVFRNEGWTVGDRGEVTGTAISKLDLSLPPTKPVGEDLLPDQGGPTLMVKARVIIERRDDIVIVNKL